MNHLHEIARRGRVVVSRVGDAEPAAGPQFLRLETQLVTQLDEQVEHDAHRFFVRAEGKDLRPDVRVQAHQLETRVAQRLVDRPAGRARLDGETELRIELAC